MFSSTGAAAHGAFAQHVAQQADIERNLEPFVTVEFFDVAMRLIAIIATFIVLAWTVMYVTG